MDAETKHILASKTVWFNILGALAEIQTQFPAIQHYTIPVVIVGNILLRYLTTKPVTILPKGD